MNASRIRAALAAHCALPQPIGARRAAAVLVPLQPIDASDEEYHVVLTRRATELVAHAGQVSFPGGHIDTTDVSPEQAAVRETQEELGIPPQAVELIGRLDDVVTGTGFHITPVVGFLQPGVTFRPDAREVARVFDVPLERLMAADLWERQSFRHGNFVLHGWRFDWDDEDVWGATAQMLHDLMDVLSQAVPEPHGALLSR